MTNRDRRRREHAPKGRNALALVALAVAAAFPARAATDLTQLSLEQLLEINVVAASKYEQKQSEVAAAVSVITRNDIRTFGWRTLAEAVAALPGVYATYDRQYTYLGVRGFGLPGDVVTRVLLTINGNRVNEIVYDGAAVGREFPLDLDLVERIEFIPGPGGAVYGQNAMFGVVNVVTRTGAGSDGAELAAAIQQPQHAREGRATWGKAFDNGVDLLLSFSGLRARGEDRLFSYPGAAADGSDVTGVARQMDGERDAEFFGRVAYRAWSLDVVHGNRRKDDPTGGYLSDPLVGGQYQRDRYLLSQLTYQDDIGGTLHLLARAFAGSYRYTAEYSYGTRFAATGSGEWRGVELRLLSTAWARHKMMVGLEAQDNARYDQTFDDLETPANNIAIPRSGYRAGVYLQDEWQVSEAIAATLGVRADRNNTTGGTKLSPRAGLIWQTTPATVLKLLYGRAHRAPNAYERDYGDGVSQVDNPMLKGESIDTLEVVADHRVARDLALRAAVYRWTMRDLIVLAIDPATGLPQYQSGERVDAHGVEVSANKTWRWGGHLRGSVSYQHANYAGGAMLDNSPQWLGRLQFSTPLPGADLRAGYELAYDGKRQAIDGSRVGGYALSRLHLLADRWARGLEVSLAIHNLFDKRYQHPAADTNWQTALEQDGRSVRLKASYRF